MLWTLAFDRVGVVMSDLYFVDPNLDQGEGGAERGVRLELRLFERDKPRGSAYSGVPIHIDQPFWRVDLLETVESEPGSLNRAHHHPRFRGWEPGRRVFVEELSNSPLTWVRDRFGAIEEVLDEAGVEGVSPEDVEGLRASAPHIAGQLEMMLGEVAAGRAGLRPPDHGPFVRSSWL
jgi:hypothetical protein